MKAVGARNRGFSLTEIAIVLAVAGIFLSMVWVAASRAGTYVKRQQVMTAISTTVSGMRHFYASQAGIPAGTTYQQLSSNMVSLGVIPASLNRGITSSCANPAPQGGANGLCADTPWGPNIGVNVDGAGTFRVCGWSWGTASPGCAATPAVTTNFFGIGLLGLSQANCIGLVENISGPNGPQGLMEVNINGTDVLETLQKPVQPVDDQTATTMCENNTPNGSVNVTFIYRLGGT